MLDRGYNCGQLNACCHSCSSCVPDVSCGVGGRLTFELDARGLG